MEKNREYKVFDSKGKYIRSYTDKEHGPACEKLATEFRRKIKGKVELIKLKK